MWSIASRARPVRSARVTALCFQEAGLQTLLSDDTPQAVAKPGLLTVPIGQAWADGIPSGVMGIRFAGSGASRCTDAVHPRGPWPSRWSTLS